MRIKRATLPGRLNAKLANVFGQKRMLQTLEEANVTQPMVPPPSAGPIRARLRDWQTEYSKYVASISSVQKQRETTLEKLFPATVNSTRNLPSDDVDDSLSNFESVEYDSSNYDSLGEMAEWMEKALIKPGYLVEISPSLSRNEPELAVCVGRQVTKLQLLTIRGKWMHKAEKDVRWTLPNWMDPKDLEPLQQYIPQQAPSTMSMADGKVFEEVTPGDITGPVVYKLNQFRNEALSIYRQHASTLDRAHEILASSTDLRIMSLQEIAEELIGSVSEDSDAATLWAVRRALLRSPNKIKPASKLTERNAQMFNIRSKEQVQIIETVQEWLREYRDAVSIGNGIDISQKHSLEQSEGFKLVDHFIKHSRELIQESRKLRDLTDIGFSPEKIETQDLTKHPRVNGNFQHHESLIIKFIELWVLGDSFQREPSLLSLPPFILSEIGLYNNRIPNSSTGLFFLIEMGVLPPWTNKLLFNADLMLPCSQTNKSLETAYHKVHHRDSKTENQFKSRLTDSLLAYRHDWGNVTVFCIDPSSAKEIDDGISIEETENPNEYWVRIHIAHPSAFLPGSDEDATSLAASLHQTFYSPESKWPMFPDYLGEHCSVRAGGPVLTISAKLDLDGNVLDFDVHPGIVQNVFRMDYGTADEVLGRQNTEGNVWIVGAQPVSHERGQSATTVSPEDVKKLNQLLIVSKKLCQRRSANGSINSGSRNQSFEVNVCSKQDYQNQIPPQSLPFMYPNRKESSTFHGQPVIELHTRPMFDEPATDQYETFGASEMVGEFMILAGSIASKWAKERNLPFIYRGAMALKSTDEILQFQKRHSLHVKKVENILDYQYHRQLVSHYGPAFGTTKPFQHCMLGLDQYAKVTSPLRRYSDMINHWQIGAALAYEHETGQKVNLEKQPEALVQFAREKGYPFRTEEGIQRLLPRFEEREKQIIHSKYYSNTFWLVQLLYRAVHHREFALPEVFRVAAIQAKVEDSSLFVAGKSLDYGVPVFLDRNNQMAKEAGGIQYCDEWEAVIKEVDLDKFMFVVSPTKLISRVDQTVLDEYQNTVESLTSLLPSINYSWPQ